ncbi:MAG: biotin/lipoyl-binding protein [Terriglobia bacterium]
MKNSRQKMKRWGSLIVIGLGTMFLFRCSWNGNSKSVLKIFGNIELTEVKFLQSAGRLVFLAVDEGNAVKKGTLIARLDPEELHERRNSASAALATSASRLEQTVTSIQFQSEQVEGQLARTC